MRKAIIVISSLFILFLAACNNSEQNTEEENNTTNSEEQAIDSIENENNEEEPGIGQDETEEADQTETEDEALEVEEDLTVTYRVSENWSIVPIEEGANEDVVLLTIDDAPDQYALEMAKTLQELDAGAIFFVNGHFLDTQEEQEILKQIHEMGFIIGNHTYSHPYLPDLTEEEQKNEIVRLNDTVEAIIGERPAFFRAPNGANTDFTKEIAKEEKMVLMNWSYGYDYFQPYMDADKLATAMITGEGPEVDVPYSLLNPGANLLMHDREWTAEALDDIVLGLREKGYEILDPHLIETIE